MAAADCANLIANDNRVVTAGNILFHIFDMVHAGLAILELRC